MKVKMYEKINTDRTVVNMEWADNKKLDVGIQPAEFVDALFWGKVVNYTCNIKNNRTYARIPKTLIFG